MSGLFYTGQNNWRGSFSDAAVYCGEFSAKNKIKQLLNPKYTGSWEWYKIHAISDEEKRDVAQYEHLPNWGIEIVAVIVSA